MEDFGATGYIPAVWTVTDDATRAWLCEMCTEIAGGRESQVEESAR
jgi:hypothetical protein